MSNFDVHTSEICIPTHKLRAHAHKTQGCNGACGFLSLGVESKGCCRGGSHCCSHSDGCSSRACGCCGGSPLKTVAVPGGGTKVVWSGGSSTILTPGQGTANFDTIPSPGDLIVIDKYSYPVKSATQEAITLFSAPSVQPLEEKSFVIVKSSLADSVATSGCSCCPRYGPPTTSKQKTSNIEEIFETIRLIDDCLT